MDKSKLSVKDLVTIGIFTAILSICSMIGGVFFAVTPTLTFYYSIGAAACKKEIMVFDEPTSGLDYKSMEEVSKLIKELAQEKWIFIVTHDYEFLNKVCTRVLRLEKGRFKDEKF